jgi:hypothetical protein
LGAAGVTDVDKLFPLPARSPDAKPDPAQLAMEV